MYRYGKSPWCSDLGGGEGGLGEKLNFCQGELKESGKSCTRQGVPKPPKKGGETRKGRGSRPYTMSTMFEVKGVNDPVDMLGYKRERGSCGSERMTGQKQHESSAIFSHGFGVARS